MKKITFRSLIVLATVIIGALVYSLTLCPPIAVQIQKLNPEITSVAGILSSYAFTIAGFLATISTFLFTLGDKPFFQYFKNNSRGSFGTLMFIHLVSLCTLATLFLVALFLIANEELLNLALTLTLITLLQLFSITAISYNLTRRSND